MALSRYSDCRLWHPWSQCFFWFIRTWSKTYFSSSSCVWTTTQDSSEENKSISMFSVMSITAAFLSLLILSVANLYLLLLFLPPEEQWPSSFTRFLCCLVTNLFLLFSVQMAGTALYEVNPQFEEMVVFQTSKQLRFHYHKLRSIRL